MKEYTEEEVRLIIEGAIAAEREECAKACEALDEESILCRRSSVGTFYANTIRARGQHGD